jgi:uncharacterized protein YoxC
MELILYLSIALISIAFAVLVVFIARTLKSVTKTLDNVAVTLEGLERQMEGITLETTQLLHKTNKLADDIQVKSEKLNTVVSAVQNVGNSLEGFNHSVSKVSSQLSSSLENNQERISQVISWSNVAMEIWEKWKQKKEILPAKAKQ